MKIDPSTCARRPRTSRAAALAGAPLLVFGCAVGPDYVPPAPEVPAAWRGELPGGAAGGGADLAAWWSAFDDPRLEDLVRRAVRGNLELAEAWGRWNEARAARGLEAAERFPALEAGAELARGRVSENVLPGTPGSGTTDDFYGAGLSASWELDLFGRVRRSVESADAELEASREDYRDVLRILCAEVATTYVELRAAEARLAYGRAGVETQRRTLQLVRDRFETGLVPELDVAQAERNLAVSRAELPALQDERGRALHRLGVLLGLPPGALAGELAAPEDGTRAVSIPAAGGAVALGAPADALRRRPDVRRAERELAAQTARIGVATAELYPRLSLGGFFSFDSIESDDLARSASRSWSLGPSLRWRLFEGGRVRSAIRVEDARAEQALARYEQTVLLALEEVENSIEAYRTERERRAASTAAASAARESVVLAKELYRTGLSDFQNVLDAERSLFVQEDRLAASEGAVSVNLIALYRALGGGRNPEPEAEA